jgi:GTPase SAR1 family protein
LEDGRQISRDETDNYFNRPELRYYITPAGLLMLLVNNKSAQHIQNRLDKVVYRLDQHQLKPALDDLVPLIASCVQLKQASAIGQVLRDACRLHAVWVAANHEISHKLVNALVHELSPVLSHEQQYQLYYELGSPLIEHRIELTQAVHYLSKAYQLGNNCPKSFAKLNQLEQDLQFEVALQQFRQELMDALPAEWQADCERGVQPVLQALQSWLALLSERQMAISLQQLWQASEAFWLEYFHLTQAYQDKSVFEQALVELNLTLGYISMPNLQSDCQDKAAAWLPCLADAIHFDDIAPIPVKQPSPPRTHWLKQLQQEETPLWHIWRKNLQDLRVLCENLLKQGHEAYTVYNAGIQGLLRTMAEQAVSYLGLPPIEFAWLGIGSTARGDMCRYSDIDCALLVKHPEDKNSAYLQAFLKLLQIYLTLLGEPWNKAEADIQSLGMMLDSEDVRQLKPNGLLLKTPEELARWTSSGNKVNSTTGHERLAYSLYTPCLLYTTTQGADLLKDYQNALSRTLGLNTPAKHIQLAQAWLIRHRQEYEDECLKPPYNKYFKNRYLAPLTYWCLDLALYHGLTAVDKSSLLANIPAVLKTLAEQTKLPAALSAILSDLWQGLLVTREYLQQQLGCREDALAHAMQWRLLREEDWRRLDEAELWLNWLHQTEIQAGLYAFKPNEPLPTLPQPTFILAVQKSLQALKQTELVSLKTYYQLLHYLVFHLRLAYGPQALNKDTEQRLTRLVEQDLLPTGFAELAKVALQQLNQWRVSHTQNDIPTLSADELLSLSIIREAIIEPLAEVLTKPQASVEELAFSCRGLLSNYLSKRFGWYQQAQVKTLPLLNCLAHYPDATGYSPHAQVYEQSNWQQLNQLIARPRSRCLVKGLLGVSAKHAYYLPQTIANELFDAQAQLIPDQLYSSTRSRVRCFAWEGQRFFIKIKSEKELGLMGRDIAVQELHSLLGGTAVTFGWAVQLVVQTDKGEPLTQWAWLSKAVAGHTLGATLTQAPEQLDEIDSLSFSQLFILALLTYPEDGQPNNFIVEPLANGRYRLVAIDNGQSFVNPHNKRLLGLYQVLNIKTMLYLMPQMYQPIAKTVIEQLRHLDATQLIAHWQQKLRVINRSYQHLLEQELALAGVPQQDYAKYNQLIDIDSTIINCVQLRLNRIQHLLKTHTSLSHLALLQKLDYKVALHYQPLIGKIQDPQKFYQHFNHAYVPNPLTGKYHSSTPWQALQNRRLSAEALRTSMQLDADYFANIDFADLNKHGEPDTQYQKLLLLLMQSITFTRLNLSSCVVLTDKTLETILKNSPHLQQLTLSHCPELTDKSWLIIYRYCKQLTHIDISHNPQLTRLKKANFPRLTDLNVNGCTQLVDIKHPFPENFNLSYKACHPRLLQQSAIKKLNEHEQALKNEQLFEIALLGRGAYPGKSTLLKRLINHRYDPNVNLTIGMEFDIFQVPNTDIKLKILDTRIQTKAHVMYPTITGMFPGLLRHTKAIIHCIDLDANSYSATKFSFDEEVTYIKEVLSHCLSDTIILIVGTKSDVANRIMSVENGQRLAREIGAIGYMECSAKTGKNVQELFQYLAQSLTDKESHSKVEESLDERANNRRPTLNDDTSHTFTKPDNQDSKNSRLATTVGLFARRRTDNTMDSSLEKRAKNFFDEEYDDYFDPFTFF